nr:hypothetical protein [Tanacetum cinerariifolium]
QDCALLGWDERHKILLGVARVVVYLHKHAPNRIIHCNVKPSNILLDERMNPKLLNFRIARSYSKKEDDISGIDYEMETLATREYPSLIHTFFLTHTIGGVFLNPEEKALYTSCISKNMLEAILNTLLMNDKFKDTAKARQDLKRLGIQSGLWLGQTKNRKCPKPQAAYSFTLENKKKFCQFIKGVKLPDGFGYNFKHKVTDNDTNITGLKSHDYHIMMQRLLSYGLQQYFPDEVAKIIIEICLFFKQICYETLIEDDMLKAQSKVVDILCNLELIYPPAFFDIMIHLVIHLPLEALEGGSIRPR